MAFQSICIFGAGAVGGHIAAHLARAGLDVSVVARGPHLQAMQRHGLRFVSPDEDFTVSVRAVQDPAELGPQDLVISTVKAHSLPGSIDGLLALLGDETPVAFAVNGLPWWYDHGLDADAAPRLKRLDPEGRLRNDLGARRAIGCVIRSPNEVVEPGVIRCNSRQSLFVFGEPDRTLSTRLEDMVAALRAGLPGAQATRDIRSEIWQKLMLNVAGSALSVLTLAPVYELLDDPQTEALHFQLMQEVRAVAAAFGTDIVFDRDALTAHGKRSKHPPSMLQDLLAGRELEIDAQLRGPQDLARHAGVATPVLDVMLPLLGRRVASPLRLVQPARA